FMALEKARKEVAASLGARSATEIVFTSGATEANNLALRGIAGTAALKGGHIVTQATEHPAVLEPMRRLEREGFELTIVGVDRWGRVDPKAVTAVLRDDTVLISLMLANNETGVVQPVSEVAAAARRRGIPTHCDAAQAMGKIPVEVEALGVDLLSISGHKVYGPKGVGALYVRRKTPPQRLEALIEGGGHEAGLRSGTANVPGAVGLACALKLASDDLVAEAERVGGLRDAFEQMLRDEGLKIVVNGEDAGRLPGTSNVAFPGVDGEALMASLPDLAVSTGSACASVHPQPSHVLRAMGLPDGLAAASLRVSFGRPSTMDHAEVAASRISEEVKRLRR
ncbi:MAG: cysteine desulfurase, partial [Thermoanaerobaculales bacterium]|nr:cysteine desulfurase [Thermoanaerobaculales bacterium]